MPRGHRGQLMACIGILALVALLAACGQTTTRAKSVTTVKTPTNLSETPRPTAIPLPYSFPKQWLPAPASSDLPAEISSLAFAPSAPRTGYACDVSDGDADNAAATPPYVVATSDGGQSWRTVSGSAAHAKSSCALFVDQSNPRDIFAEAGNLLHGGQQLYRSQDGGATWAPIPQPTVTGWSTSVIAVAVVQSRLLAIIVVNGEGNAPHSLYASDNGGQSWTPIDLTINGQTLDISAQLWFDGPALVIEAAPPCTGGCGYALPAGSGRMGRRPLSQPLSSQPPAPNAYFKSSDGGRTWIPFATPAQNLSNLTFTRSSDGSTTYALGTATGVPNQPAASNVAFYSRDGGAHWRQLPTLAGAENGYLDPGSLGQGGLDLLPDGSVAAMTFHTIGTTEPPQGFYAGVFLLRPNDASPSWRPLISRDDGSFWQATPTAAGLRVWQIRFPPAPPDALGPAGGRLVYFDLP